MQNENLTISALTIIVMFLWALCFPLISVGLAYVPPLFFAFLRALLSGVLLLVVGKYLNREPISGRSNWLLISGIGISATSIGFWGMFYAGGILSPGLATVLTNTQPLIATFLAWLILKEKLKMLELVAIVIGFTGVLLVSIGPVGLQNDFLVLGVLYVLVASAAIATGNVLMKKVATKVDTIHAMGWQLIIGSVPLALFSMIREPNLPFQFTLEFFLSLIFLCSIGTALPFVLWFWLLKKRPLYKLNMYTFLTPIFGLALGFIFYSESFTLVQISGVILVIVGIWQVNQNKSIIKPIG